MILRVIGVYTVALGFYSIINQTTTTTSQKMLKLSIIPNWRKQFMDMHNDFFNQEPLVLKGLFLGNIFASSIVQVGNSKQIQM